jgi:xanthine dehydrogenase accessory factor
MHWNWLQRVGVSRNVTRGHLHDKVVLAQALGTEAVYIGMIGSRKKRDTIYRALRDEGFTDDGARRSDAC